MKNKPSFAAMGRLLLCTSLLFLLCGMAQAANHYVDKDAGGANNGTS